MLETQAAVALRKCSPIAPNTSCFLATLCLDCATCQRALVTALNAHEMILHRLQLKVLACATVCPVVGNFVRRARCSCERCQQDTPKRYLAV
eukprot:510146-Amphidinium_carterae.1